jgi:hypothetical protein
MPIWNYMELEVKNWPKATLEMSVDQDGKSVVGRTNLITSLNMLGGKGWEAYHLEYQNGSVARVFLKRNKG